MKEFPEYLDMFEKFIELSNIKIVEKSEYKDTIAKFDDIRDKYDAHIVACAEAKDCDYIISGDRDLLEYENCDIDTLRAPEYLDEIYGD